MLAYNASGLFAIPNRCIRSTTTPLGKQVSLLITVAKWRGTVLLNSRSFRRQLNINQVQLSQETGKQEIVFVCLMDGKGKPKYVPKYKILEHVCNIN